MYSAEIYAECTKAGGFHGKGLLPLGLDCIIWDKTFPRYGCPWNWTSVCITTRHGVVTNFLHRYTKRRWCRGRRKSGRSPLIQEGVSLSRAGRHIEFCKAVPNQFSLSEEDQVIVQTYTSALPKAKANWEATMKELTNIRHASLFIAQKCPKPKASASQWSSRGSLIGTDYILESAEGKIKSMKRIRFCGGTWARVYLVSAIGCWGKKIFEQIWYFEWKLVRNLFECKSKVDLSEKCRRKASAWTKLRSRQDPSLEAKSTTERR